MHIHKNARLTVLLREELARRVIHDHVQLNKVASEFKVSRITAAKWVRRFRGSRPARIARSKYPATPEPYAIVL